MEEEPGNKWGKNIVAKVKHVQDLQSFGLYGLWVIYAKQV